MTRGWSTRNASTRRPGEDEAAQRPDRDDVGDRRLAEEDRDLAEELAAAERARSVPSTTTAASPSRIT